MRAILSLLALAALLGAATPSPSLPRPHLSPDLPSAREYMEERARFIQSERHRFLGSSLELSDKEMVVNKRLMASKRGEYNVPESKFPPAQSFFKVRRRIENSDVFKFIQKMPKGGALHVHDLAAAAVDYVIANVTYRDNLWANFETPEPQMKFAASSPGAGWALLRDVRELVPSRADFDNHLRRLFTITVPDPEDTYPDQDKVWDAFNKRFGLLFSTLVYEPVMRDYFLRTLQDFYEDNVMYMELRVVLPPVYDLQGKVYDPLRVAKIYRELTDEFTKTHPGFLGVRFIYAPSRHVPIVELSDYMAIFTELKKSLKGMFVGFDLVSHEDDGRPLIDFALGLLELRRRVPDTKFFFHAGETNWQGTTTDENLVDAVLLNTTRIGHGYAIVKHPHVLEEVKQRGIGIEINPVSNQVLNLVKDLRNHPGSMLLADDYPVVISSDDPGMWDAKGLSYDFYEAFMGMAGQHADLRMLKQLAINSFKFSSLDEHEKTEALALFESQWQTFIDQEVSESSDNSTL